MSDEELRRLIDDNEPEPYGVSIIGPFMEGYKLTADGYRVPHLMAYLIPGTEDDWNLVCDERFIIETTSGEIRRWLWFVANCMAVAAGYSCHGEHSRISNPYQVQMSRIETVELERE